MFCSTFAFSTFAQFGLVGTNQLNFAARANGASFGFEALKAKSFVVLAMLPAFAISLSAAVLVNALIQSAARLWFFVVTGIARSDPPRNVGMNRPLTWLGIGYAPTIGARDGLPTFSSRAYGHSQPLPMNEPTLPLAKTSACCGLASSVVLLARVSVLKAPAAMYFVISVLPSSITSGASPPASAASNFWRWLPQLWYWTSTSTSGCCALKFRLASATASGQPLCASFWSQTTIFVALAAVVPPLAVEAAAARATARTAAAMNRIFISASRSGLNHLPRRGDWHRPPAVSRDEFSTVFANVVLTTLVPLC